MTSTKTTKRAPHRAPMQQPAPAATRREHARGAALRTGRIVNLAGRMRTMSDIERALDALPADFARTKIPALVLQRDAATLARRRVDVPLFAARGIDITAGHFELIAELSELLRGADAARDTAGAVISGYAALEARQVKELRRHARRLRLLAKLNGLSPRLASLGDVRGPLRLMEAGASVVARLTACLGSFEQVDEARRLVAQLEQTVNAMKELRTKRAGERHHTDRVHRVKRLLLDALRYVAVAGRYLFADDPGRAAAYRLKQVAHHRRPRKRPAAAPSPAAGASVPSADVSLPDADASLPDAGAALPSAGASLPSAGASLPHAGASVPHAGAPLPDAGASLPDAGAPLPDAGASIPGAGAPLPYASASPPDAGAPLPGAGAPFPDAGASVAGAGAAVPEASALLPDAGAALPDASPLLGADGDAAGGHACVAEPRPDVAAYTSD